MSKAIPQRCILLGSKSLKTATTNGLRFSPTNNLYDSVPSDVAVLLRPKCRHGGLNDHPLKGIINETPIIPP